LKSRGAHASDEGISTEDVV